ncbi:hypothetical protein BH23GEM3_BH23GEM3_09770 [soil metagenome]
MPRYLPVGRNDGGGKKWMFLLALVSVAGCTNDGVMRPSSTAEPTAPSLSTSSGAPANLGFILWPEFDVEQSSPRSKSCTKMLL